MSKERPILMQGAMVRAVLADQKTQTRIVCKPQPETYSWPKGEQWAFVKPEPGYLAIGTDCEDALRLCPHGTVGDRLWVITIKPIEFGDGKYGAGDDGNVYEISGQPRKRSASIGHNGYEEITLRSGGESKRCRVNRLVCEAFYGKCPKEFPKCRHLDDNRRNNRPSNLDWGTDSQNTADANSKGAWSGEKNGGSFLIKKDIIKIRESKEKQSVLAVQFNVSQPTISKIKSAKRWRMKNPEKPPRNFPIWVSRITLEITGVRVERVQDISPEDAISEGLLSDEFPIGGDSVQKYGLEGWQHRHWRQSPVDAFEYLWDSINGRRTGCAWKDNPWCWCISFRRIPDNPTGKKPVEP